MKYLHWFQQPPVYQGNLEKTRRAELLHYSSISLIFFILILMAFNWLYGTQAEKSVNWLLGVIIGLMVGAQWGIRRGYVKSTSLTLLVFSWFSMLIFARRVEGIHDTAIMGFVLILLGSGYLLGWQAELLFTAGSIGALWWLADLEARGIIVLSPINPYRVSLDLTVIFIIISLIIYFIINTLTRSIRNMQHELNERLRMETALQNEQERLQFALGSAKMGTWNWHIASGTVSWSDKIEAMFGMQQGEFDGKYETYLSLIHPDDLPNVQNAIQSVLDNENASYFVEHRLTWPDGSLHWLEGRGRVDRDEAGNPIHMAGTVVDVTDRKQSENALRDADLLYRTLVEQIPAITYVDEADYDVTTQYVSPQVEQILGFSPEEWKKGKVDFWLNLLHAEEREKALQAVRHSVETGDPLDMEYRIFAANGSLKWLHDRAVLLKDENGKPRWFHGVMFDITEQKQVEAALRQAEEKYRDIVENAVDGIFQSTPGGRFISVNPAMARMYGYESPEEMIQSVKDIARQIYVKPELREGLARRLANGEQITGFESQDHRKDRSIFWTSMNVRAIRDLGGNVLYYEGTVEDISNRKAAEEGLRKSEERYRSLFDGILDGVYRSSHGGRFLDVNPAMVKMFGYDSREEMLALDIKQEMYFAPEDRESLFLDTGQEKVDIFRMRRKDGSEIWVEDHGRYVHDADGNVIYHEGILRDITPRRLAEAEREHLIRELAAKNRELEQFTYTVSHDLKAPIITIKGFLGFLEKDVATGKQEQTYKDVQRISEAVDKTHRLLNELLELSRIGRLINPPEDISFKSLVEEAIDIVGGRLQARHIKVEVAANLPVVRGDRQRLVEVLQNLLDNAAKFMGDQKEPHIRIGSKGEENGQPIFYVQDNGMGILPNFHERIFGLFNKLNADIEGTGIGLAIVKRIIEVHGGRIWVESEAGQGTTFLFTLSGQV